MLMLSSCASCLEGGKVLMIPHFKIWYSERFGSRKIDHRLPPRPDISCRISLKRTIKMAKKLLAGWYLKNCKWVSWLMYYEVVEISKHLKSKRPSLNSLITLLKRVLLKLGQTQLEDGFQSRNALLKLQKGIWVRAGWSDPTLTQPTTRSQI